MKKQFKLTMSLKFFDFDNLDYTQFNCTVEVDEDAYDTFRAHVKKCIKDCIIQGEERERNVPSRGSTFKYGGAYFWGRFEEAQSYTVYYSFRCKKEVDNSKVCIMWNAINDSVGELISSFDFASISNCTFFLEGGIVHFALPKNVVTELYPLLTC